MNIIVCIKQVPDTTDVKTDPKTGTLIREGVPSILNPDDRHAIEEAIRLKEIHGGKVIALTMGPPQAKRALKEVFAMGADQAILLSDREFAGADTWATSYTLAMAVKKIKDYDIIFCGRQAIDGDTAQIGPQLAESLKIPQVTYVKDIKIKDGICQVERALETGHMEIEVKMPVLFTAIKELNEPRYPTLKGIINAHRNFKITVWNAKDLNTEPEKIGLIGSPTQVKRTFSPEPKGTVEMITGSGIDMANTIIDRLKSKNVVR
jgi:electron transfer flavoprotein alpha/beta subunit